MGALFRAVQPLEAALVWATYQGLVAQGARAAAPPVEVSWSKQQHAAALRGLKAPVPLGGGIWAERVDEAIVVRRAPVGEQTLERLIHEGFLSALAGRTLLAALELGCNLVWTGPQIACERAMFALAAQGGRPGVWCAPGAAAVPQGFVAVDDAQLAWRAGIDRLVAPLSLTPAAMAMLGVQTSAQAWLPAGGLERALMRLELSSGVAANEAAVHLLAAVNVIVVVAVGASPHVAQIAELRLVDSGYRPALVFTTGQAIAPQALVPVEAPSFVAALRGIGQQALADDWAYASAPTRSEPVWSGAASGTQAPPQAAPKTAAIAQRPPGPMQPRPKVSPAQTPGLSSQPGWELDRLLAMQPQDAGAMDLGPAEAPLDPAHAAEVAEAASLAAQFGLGPPPPPRQRAPRSSNFSDALAFASGAGALKQSAPDAAELAHPPQLEPLGLGPVDADADADENDNEGRG